MNRGQRSRARYSRRRNVSWHISHNLERPAVKHEAAPGERATGDNSIADRVAAKIKSCPVAALQKIFGSDRRRLSWALGLPMKYLAEVVSGNQTAQRLRAAALEKYGLDIENLPATFDWRAQRTSWLERSQPKEEDGE